MFACILADSLNLLLLMSTALSVARNHENIVLEKSQEVTCFSFQV